MPPPKQKPMIPSLAPGTRRPSSVRPAAMSPTRRSGEAAASAAGTLPGSPSAAEPPSSESRSMARDGVAVARQATRHRPDVIGEPAVLVDHEHRPGRGVGGGEEPLQFSGRPGEGDRLAGSGGRGGPGRRRRVAEAPAGADDPSTGRVAAGLGEICAAQAASRADADEAVMPSRINRRTASRRVIRPSTQSSPTSVVRYSRSAMGRTSTSDLGASVSSPSDTRRHRPRFWARLPDSASVGYPRGRGGVAQW